MRATSRLCATIALNGSHARSWYANGYSESLNRYRMKPRPYTGLDDLRRMKALLADILKDRPHSWGRSQPNDCCPLRSRFMPTGGTDKQDEHRR